MDPQEGPEYQAIRAVLADGTEAWAQAWPGPAMPGQAGPSGSGLAPRRVNQAKSAGVNSRDSTSTIQLPELSRATASTPYGRSSGAWMNSTPLARRSS
jgi:hypothetical protein